MDRFEIFKEGCVAMDSGDYEEAARQFWKLFMEMDKKVKYGKFDMIKEREARYEEALKEDASR